MTEISAQILVLVAVLTTSTLSGVFGMAGGLLLMGALLLVLPVPAAMVAHGVLQLTANGSRAVLHRHHLQWHVITWYSGGSLLAALVLRQFAVNPSKPWVLLGLGLLPTLVWLPPAVVSLDASRNKHAVCCGFGVTALHIVAGVAGPLLDLFFVRTSLPRHAIVATKAATQVLAHALKVLFYAGAVVSAPLPATLQPQWLVAAMALALVGSWLGAKILDRLSDRSFMHWTKGLVTAVGAVYLGQALWLFS
ncbi:MAG: sulfite exporter TauE/SafE family protein [Myxococcales bacterium]|nr:sulfite exporter TauE/SafE family protein [Myxococcales bacterium]